MAEASPSVCSRLTSVVWSENEGRGTGCMTWQYHCSNSLALSYHARTDQSDQRRIEIEAHYQRQPFMIVMIIMTILV